MYRSRNSKEVSNLDNKIWSIVSKAALRSNSVKTDISIIPYINLIKARINEIQAEIYEIVIKDFIKQLICLYNHNTQVFNLYTKMKTNGH